MRSRKLTLVVGGVTAALLLTACAAGKDAPGQQAKAACKVTAPSTATTVNVLAYTSPAIDPFSSALVGCTGTKNLTVRHSPVDFAGQLAKANLSLAAKSPSYDVVEVYTSTLTQYAQKGWIVPLDDMIAKYKNKYDLGDISPKLLKEFTYKGRVYGLPNQVNVHSMVYRKDIFDKLNLKVPTTFDELVSAAQAIAKAKVVKYPITVPISAGVYAASDFYNSVSSLGGALTEPGTNKPQLDTPTAAAALQSLRRLVPYMSPSAINTDESAATTAMENGSAAISMTYSGDLGQLLKSSNSKYSKDFAFAPAPAVKAGGKPWGTAFLDGFAVAKNSKVSPDLLFQLVSIGTGKAATKAAGPAIYPARTSVLNDSQLRSNPETAYWPAVTSILDKGTGGPPPDPFFGDLEAAIRPALADGIFGKKSIAAALSSAQSTATDFLRQGGYLK